MRQLTDTEILSAARTAQAERIKKNLLISFCGGGCRIDTWDDFRYYLSSFSANDVLRVLVPLDHRRSLSQIRNRLRKLVQAGELLDVSYTARHIAFKFHRDICDGMAEQAIAELIAQGYSETEIRTLPKPTMPAPKPPVAALLQSCPLCRMDLQRPTGYVCGNPACTVFLKASS